MTSIGNQLVLQMPFVCEGDDAVGGETPELITDQIHLLAEPGIAEAVGVRMRKHHLGQARLRLGASARVNQPAGRFHIGPDLGAARADLTGAHDLALAHRNAAGDLRKIFRERDLENQRLDLAQLSGVFEPPRPAEHLAQGLDIGRDPGKAVRLVLRVIDATRFGDAHAHGFRQSGKQLLRAKNRSVIFAKVSDCQPPIARKPCRECYAPRRNSHPSVFRHCCDR